MRRSQADRRSARATDQTHRSDDDASARTAGRSTAGGFATAKALALSAPPKLNSPGHKPPERNLRGTTCDSFDTERSNTDRSQLPGGRRRRRTAACGGADGGARRFSCVEASLALFGLRKEIMTKVSVAPNWTDLLMWAIVKGKHSLCRDIWEQSAEPLRAAILACRATRHIALHDKPQGSADAQYTIDELLGLAAEYEKWATGLLNRVPDDKQQVMNLLTRAPVQPCKAEAGEKGAVVKLWEQSVLDEATERVHPAIQFVSHRHCQAVLRAYWHGNFSGSCVHIAGGSLIFVLLQIFVQILFCNLPPRCVCPVPTEEPKYSLPMLDASDRIDDATEDDEFCRAYFSANAVKEAADGRLSQLASAGGGGSSDGFWFPLMDSYLELWLLRGCCGGLAREAAQRRAAALDRWLHQQWRFWSIPKVRFALDVIFKVIELINIIFLTMGHFYIREWMASYRTSDDESLSGEYVDGVLVITPAQSELWIAAEGDSKYLDLSWSPPLNANSWRVFCEMLCLIFAVARLHEYVGSLSRRRWSPFRFFIFAKWVDTMAALVLVATIICRLAIMWSVMGVVAQQYWYHMTQASFAVTAFFQFFLILPVLTYDRRMGQTLTMLFEMINDCLSVLVVMFWMVLGLGVALVPLLPTVLTQETDLALLRSNLTNGTDIRAEVSVWVTNKLFQNPFFHGFYAWLSLIDIGEYEPYVGESYAEVSLAILLIAIFTLFVAIFCMNLLIAKMTTRYDSISNASASYRRFQHITLIKRYKDEGPPPPINLLVAIGNVLLVIYRKCRGLCYEVPPKPPAVQSAFTVYAGHAATRQSERIERSYLRDFLREDEAKQLAKGDHASEELAELPGTIQLLRQEFAERLDRLESATRQTSRPSKSFHSSFRSSRASRPTFDPTSRHPSDGWHLGESSSRSSGYRAAPLDDSSRERHAALEEASRSRSETAGSVTFEESVAFQEPSASSAGSRYSGTVPSVPTAPIGALAESERRLDVSEGSERGFQLTPSSASCRRQLSPALSSPPRTPSQYSPPDGLPSVPDEES